MKINKIVFVLAFLFLLLTVLFTEKVYAAEIVVTGECFFTPSGGGSQSFQSVLFSPPEAVSLSIYGTRHRWKIVAKMIDQSMAPGGIQLWVRRTNEGMGPGEITGDLSYILLEPQEKAIFRGVGDISNIPLQFKLTGINPQTPESIFQSEIFLKVVDMP